MTLPRLSFGILFLAVVIFLSCVDCASAKALKDPKEKKPELLKRNSQEKTPSEVKNKQTLLGRLSRFAEALLEILETILPKFIGDRLRKVVDRSGDKVCYDYVGCFSADDGATLPVSFPRDPKTVNASYSLYSRGNRDTPVLLDYTPTSSKASLIQFRMSKPLIIIVHGWQEDTSTRWVDDMKNAMLEKLDCNVICAHWGKSALLLNYIQSAGDTALVGREVSLLVQALLVSYPNTLSALQVHVIGYSLGAHIGGFFGRHFKGATGKIIGRISGKRVLQVYLFKDSTDNQHV